ncbi:MAG: MFS transporter [Firmicutes bacterium]|nr:MFS transporter [Bacillota bacterium]
MSVNTVVSPQVSIPSRLERLGNSPYLMRLCGIVLLGYMFASFSLTGIGYLMPSLGQDWELTPVILGYLSSIIFVAMFLGAFVGGFLGDKVGRKPVLVVCSLLWGIGSILMGLAWSLPVLFFGRTLIGIGLGGQMPLASVILGEMVPSNYRGKYLNAAIMSLVIGQALVGLLTYLLLPVVGWRGVLIVVGCFGLWGLVMWKYLPESAAWLSSKAKYEEADKIMSKIENGVEKSIGRPLPEPVEIKPDKEVMIGDVKESEKSIFSKHHLKNVILVTFFMVAQMMANYGMSLWLTQMLVLKGFEIIKSIGYVSFICLGGIPAFFFVSYMVDTIGRKKSVIIMALLTAITVYFYGQAAVFALVILTGLMYMFSQNGYNMATLVFTVELWPTRLRSSGRGYCQACGRVGSFLGPTIVGYILAAGYATSVVMVFAACLCIFGALAVGIFGPETKGKVV